MTAAAEAIGCEPAMIAKTLSFIQDGKPVLILADGLARIDNHKYKERFGCKAKMIPAEQVEPLIGHDVGGVCPFGINDGVVVYLDESLRRHEICCMQRDRMETIALQEAMEQNKPILGICRGIQFINASF